MKKFVASRKNFYFKGLNELAVALNKSTDITAVKEVLALNISELEENAKRLSPHETGFLERSIGISSDIASAGLSMKVKANADYAGYLEWGTRFQYAQPYMKPAYMKQRVQFIKDMKLLMK